MFSSLFHPSRSAFFSSFTWNLSQSDYRLRDDTNKVPAQQLSERESPLNNRAEGAAKHSTERSSIHPSARPPPPLHPNSTWWLISALSSLLRPRIPSFPRYLSVPVLPPRLSASTRSHLPADRSSLSSVTSSNTHYRFIRRKRQCNWVTNEQADRCKQCSCCIFTAVDV